MFVVTTRRDGGRHTERFERFAEAVAAAGGDLAAISRGTPCPLCEALSICGLCLTSGTRRARRWA